MDGLRAGGGDKWNAEFREFLRAEWQHVSNVTGQPFGFKILERDEFEYDTEYACRAVISARVLLGADGLANNKLISFFELTQRKFYVEGEDPKQLGFYVSICRDLNLDFKVFANVFLGMEARNLTDQEFYRARSLGVRSFPTILLQSYRGIEVLATGYVDERDLLARIDGLRATSRRL